MAGGHRRHHGRRHAYARGRGRRLTQPAFSRRVRTIEQHLGVDLIDRGHRPARLRQSILDQEDRLRSLVSGLRQLEHELRRGDASSRTRVVIAS